MSQAFLVLRIRGSRSTHLETRLLDVWRGGAWSESGGPGVGARCGNGLFPLINLPNFILVSLILVEYPDKIGPVNTYGTVP